jgi:2-polyprenyl-3-methyl-5-hydroxy-6-metoxy-1,4-benzoquinol methylase
MDVPSLPWPNFAHRSETPELMDRPDIPPAELEAALFDIAKVNYFLGGSASLLSGLKKLTQDERPFPKQILDLGCGGGDLTIDMARWVHAHYPDTQVTGIDLLPSAIAFAQKRHLMPGLSFAVGDAFHLQAERPDETLLTCSMFLHHLQNQDIQRLLTNAYKAGFGAMVINDLHRHFWAYWGFRGISALARFSPMATYDGAVSVSRSFIRSDWNALVSPTGWHLASLQWHWAFRWTVVLKRNV